MDDADEEPVAWRSLRKKDMPKPTTIDLSPDDNEAQVAIRHPDGQVVVLSLKAHRSTLTAFVPAPVQVRGTDDPDELVLSWLVSGEPDGSPTKH